MIDGQSHMLAGMAKDKLQEEGVAKTTNLDLTDLFRVMDELGIERLVTFVQEMERIYKRWLGSNDNAIELQSKHPERIIGIMGAEPMDDRNVFHKKRLEEIRSAVVDQGIKGVCITPPYGHFFANDRRAYPFYEMAVELNFAVMFHHGGGVGGGGGLAWQSPIKYARPVVLDDLVVDFPELRIHVEHMAYPWSEELFAIMKHGPNVYTDVAELFTRPTILAWYIMMAKEYGVIDRVVWGSDYDVFWKTPVHVDTYREKVETETAWMKNDLNEILGRSGWTTLTENEIEGILGENSRRFFKL